MEPLVVNVEGLSLQKITAVARPFLPLSALCSWRPSVPGGPVPGRGWPLRLGSHSGSILPTIGARVCGQARVCRQTLSVGQAVWIVRLAMLPLVAGVAPSAAPQSLASACDTLPQVEDCWNRVKTGYHTILHGFKSRYTHDPLCASRFWVVARQSGVCRQLVKSPVCGRTVSGRCWH